MGAIGLSAAIVGLIYGDIPTVIYDMEIRSDKIRANNNTATLSFRRLDYNNGTPAVFRSDCGGINGRLAQFGNAEVSAALSLASVLANRRSASFLAWRISLALRS